MSVCGAPDTKKVKQNIWYNHYRCIWYNHYRCISNICPHGVKGGEWKKKALMRDPSLEYMFETIDKKSYPKLVHIDMIDKYLKDNY